MPSFDKEINLIAGEPIKLPRGGNVFNFVKSDLTGKGSIYTTMLTPYEHLEVFDAQGTSLWKSDDYFGGSLIFMEWMDTNRNRQADTPVRVFLPSPIFLGDVDGDDKNEVVVCQNISKTMRITEDFRWFGSGKVHFMAWDGVALGRYGHLRNYLEPWWAMRWRIWTRMVEMNSLSHPLPVKVIS